MFESNGTSVEQMSCIEICNEFSCNFHDLGNLLGLLNILHNSQLLHFNNLSIYSSFTVPYTYDVIFKIFT